MFRLSEAYSLVLLKRWNIDTINSLLPHSLATLYTSSLFPTQDTQFNGQDRSAFWWEEWWARETQRRRESRPAQCTMCAVYIDVACFVNAMVTSHRPAIITLAWDQVGVRVSWHLQILFPNFTLSFCIYSRNSINCEDECSTNCSHGHNKCICPFVFRCMEIFKILLRWCWVHLGEQFSKKSQTNKYRTIITEFLNLTR